LNGRKKAALALVVVAAIGAAVAYAVKRNGWHRAIRKAILARLPAKKQK